MRSIPAWEQRRCTRSLFRAGDAEDGLPRASPKGGFLPQRIGLGDVGSGVLASNIAVILFAAQFCMEWEETEEAE
jgi:hypothetical protein